ncbi:uncharacterized protein LOC130996965 isoform X2 [Salvia miltiorrhiza]|uniref:uncharacterized protein LOC130996965 isoform X2 n=1 Tax=Salvia miltiorrhiza TaxID=226208 RepID=UPI0025ACC86D|nr:uncharacterized protein LOC130996965 isoform X2 [Salvia miltiorrhiza]
MQERDNEETTVVGESPLGERLRQSNRNLGEYRTEDFMERTTRIHLDEETARYNRYIARVRQAENITITKPQEVLSFYAFLRESRDWVGSVTVRANSEREHRKRMRDVIDAVQELGRKDADGNNLVVIIDGRAA